MSSVRVLALAAAIVTAVGFGVFLVGAVKVVNRFWWSPPARSVISSQAPASSSDPLPAPSQTLSPALDLSTLGALQITTTPAGASFAVHPSSKAEATPPITPPLREGLTPGAVEDLPPRRYTIFLRLSGWPEERQEITLSAGETLPVDFAFPHGQAEVTSEPDGAQIFHGDRWLGRTPLTVELPLGEQELIARATNRPERVQKVLIASATTTAVSFDLRGGKSRSTRRRAEPPSGLEKFGRSIKKFFAPKDRPSREKK